MTSETQIIETILERDVDLILLEELSANVLFTKWFVNQLELPDLTENKGAWRSISDFGLGETDLVLLYKSNEKIILVLIENKLDSNFQELQFERYQKRGELYKSEAKCSDYYSILVAPNQYAERQNDFEKYISYEDLRDYFEFEGSRRSNFKASLLKIAIEKSKRGYQPLNSEPVQRFWQAYWEYKEGVFPEFAMRKPLIVPLESDWIQLRNVELMGIVFFHKLSKGFIDATFSNFPEGAEARIRGILPKEYIIEKHKSGRFSIRQKTVSIDRILKFEDQIERVKIGLAKIREVSNWISLNFDRISL